MGLLSLHQLRRRFGITVVLGLAFHSLFPVHDVPGAWERTVEKAGGRGFFVAQTALSAVSPTA